MRYDRGQGLVEMALMLPILLVLIVGIVEAGAALHEQLVVVNAAREGARFGAFGAAPADVCAQTRYATTHLLELDRTAIVVIEMETNHDGTGFARWQETGCPEGAATGVTQERILEGLGPGAGGLRLVVVDVRYDHKSMLGFPFVGALADRVPIGSWTVMRVFAGGE